MLFFHNLSCQPLSHGQLPSLYRFANHMSGGIQIKYLISFYGTVEPQFTDHRFTDYFDLPTLFPSPNNVGKSRYYCNKYSITPTLTCIVGSSTLPSSSIFRAHRLNSQQNFCNCTEPGKLYASQPDNRMWSACRPAYFIGPKYAGRDYQ